MRAPESSSPHVLQQSLACGVSLLQAITRRHTHRASMVVGRAWRMYRPAHLPLYALGGIVGVAVVLLVVTAWLRVMMPMVFGQGVWR
jgi:hypothetical protein